MKTTATLAVALALSLAAPLATGAATAEGFSTKYARAKKNIVPPPGARFDQTLGIAMARNAEVKAAMAACLKQYPGPQAVHGYFEFISTTEYRVVLQPASPFATCFEKALQGRRVPLPPSLPYVNPFDFATAPPKPQ